MIFKNSMKLLASNFSFVWKQLAYNIVRVLIIIGLTLLVASPIYKLLKAEGFLQTLTELWQLIYTDPIAFFSQLNLLVNNFLDIIGKNIATIWYAVLLFFIVIIVINSMLKSMGQYALTSIAHNNFTSQVNTGYCHAIVSNLKKIMIYALSMLLVNLPFAIIKFALVAMYCAMLGNWVTAVLGICLFIVLYTFTYAMQITVCHACSVRLIEDGRSPIKNLLTAFGSIKDFGRVFSNAIVIVILLIAINFGLGLFTVGAGLIITLPASMVVITIFQLVSFYTINKHRYYLSQNIIVDAI